MSDPKSRRQRARRFERFVQLFVFVVGALVVGRQLFVSDQTRFERMEGYRVVLDLPAGSISDASQMSWSPSSRGTYTPDGPVMLGANVASVETTGASITAIRTPMRVYLEEGERPRVAVLLVEPPSEGPPDREITAAEPLRLTHPDFVLDVVVSGSVSGYADSMVVWVGER